MSFSGFGPDALPFFKALGFHQTREWFEANRATYETQVKAPLGDLVEDVAAAFAAAGVPLKGDRKASLFRLNRDVRFAKDKSPYKTQAGAVLTRTGAKDDQGLMYIHIAPDGCFVAAGFYHPEPEDLARLRRAIVRAPAEYQGIVAALAQAKVEFRHEESLKRLPRSFEAIEAPEIAAAAPGYAAAEFRRGGRQPGVAGNNGTAGAGVVCGAGAGAAQDWRADRAQRRRRLPSVRASARGRAHER